MRLIAQPRGKGARAIAENIMTAGKQQIVMVRKAKRGCRTNARCRPARQRAIRAASSAHARELARIQICRFLGHGICLFEFNRQICCNSII